MGQLIFKGTVDEIDVGKLKDGLPVRIQIGALPTAEVKAHLRRIAPKASEKDGATQFSVEAAIDDDAGVTLRAGYSANASIIIQEKKDVLLIPERIVTFEGEKPSSAAVGQEGSAGRAQGDQGRPDGLNVEVLSGLAGGPPRRAAAQRSRARDDHPTCGSSCATRAPSACALLAVRHRLGDGGGDAVARFGRGLNAQVLKSQKGPAYHRHRLALAHKRSGRAA
jgi:hypothetical protein